MKRFATECTDAEQDRIVAVLSEVCPRILPADWSTFGPDEFWNSRLFKSRDGLLVCIEVEYQDAELYLHVSFSRTDRDPNYFDMKRVKDVFIGPKRKAIMVLPSEAEHFNQHKHCLHWFSPLERDPLPDFRHASGSL